jgi:hypothetical protein
MSDICDLRDFNGLDLTGANDCTSIVDNAMAQAGIVNAPFGTVAVQYVKARSSTQLRGNARGSGGNQGTIFKFISSGASGLYAATKGTSQTFDFEMSNIQFLDSAGLARVLDFTDMMFCRIDDCFAYGYGGVGSSALYLGSTNTSLQATYNKIFGLYTGNVQYGTYYHDGANANTILGGRAQSSLTNAIGHLFAPSGFNLVNANVLINIGVEQPGNTMTGVQLNGNTGGTTLVSPRLESLLNGVVIGATDVNVSLVDPKYYGCTNELVDASEGKAFLNGTSAGLGGPNAQINYDGTSNTIIKAVNCTISKSATGQYVISGLPFGNTGFTHNLCCSTGRLEWTIVSSSTVNVFTYNSSGVAADAAVVGTFFQ